MKNPFQRGVLCGLVAPLFFGAAVVFWIHRATQRVPFPVEGPAEDQLMIRLVYPEQVPELWAPWRARIEPLIRRLQGALGQ